MTPQFLLRKIIDLLPGILLCVAITLVALVLQAIEVHFAGEPYLEALVAAIAAALDAPGKLAGRHVIVTAGPWFTEPEDQHLAGVFAGLQPFGQLYQVPTRLPRYPDDEWGALLLSGAASVDGYDTRFDDVRRPGRGDRHRLYQVDLPP